MIFLCYCIVVFIIGGVGQGLFFDEVVCVGSIIMVLDVIECIWCYDELVSLLELVLLCYVSVCWFEDCYIVLFDWLDECYVNYSFLFIGLWYLGFIFVLIDFVVGVEVMVDYCYLLLFGEVEDFVDLVIGEIIVGFVWEDVLVLSM